MSEMRDLIEDKLREKAKDNRISCTAAHQIAKELVVPVRKVGNLAKELNIKIVACELGCF